MKVIIDRFEGDFAVVEISKTQFANLPKSLVPIQAKEGDVINIEVDRTETERRKEEIDKMMKDIWVEN